MASLELYLIRHGIATAREEGGADELRTLTPDGVARLRQTAGGLQSLGVTFDVILTSPLVRARQTADLLGEVMRDSTLVVSAALAPSGSPSDVIAEIAKYGSRASLALVGHEPGMGALAARLLGAAEPIPFKKGGICRLDFTALPPVGVATLRWFATPKMLRLLGRGKRD